MDTIETYYANLVISYLDGIQEFLDSDKINRLRKTFIENNASENEIKESIEIIKIMNKYANLSEKTFDNCIKQMELAKQSLKLEQQEYFMYVVLGIGYKDVETFLIPTYAFEINTEDDEIKLHIMYHNGNELLLKYKVKEEISNTELENVKIVKTILLDTNDV